MMKHEFDALIGMTTAPECYERIEYVYQNCPFFSETNGKQQIADFYLSYDMNGIERLYRETKKIMQDKEAIKSMRKQNAAGSHMEADDYENLKRSAEIMTDTEAAIFVNKNFGFEASRIEILHEREVNATEGGSHYLKIEKAEGLPLYASTDWNYVRFNVHTPGSINYYEIINDSLRAVYI